MANHWVVPQDFSRLASQQGCIDPGTLDSIGGTWGVHSLLLLPVDGSSSCRAPALSGFIEAAALEKELSRALSQQSGRHALHELSAWFARLNAGAQGVAGGCSVSNALLR